MVKFLVFGGGGKVAQHLARIGVKEGHEIHSVIRNDGHKEELEKVGAKVHISSLETATVPDITSLISSVHPEVVVFAAGAGGNPPGPEVIDYKGAVKVFDALEASNTKRLVLIGAVDVRTREKGWPDWYDEKDKDTSDRVWKAIPAYLEAKLKAEIELHTRKQIQYTVLRPGNLTLEPAGGVELGKTHLKATSRELVAKTILAVATERGTEGLTIDVMDGDGSISEEVAKVVKNKTDAWTG
ncbi:hypothetical protein I317_05257 [Kwoniella heveanensis CBS 569]|uniref:NAD(P)-binding domain-containing protein n=1 Tax=Kwoniella heveanensis BCC8398 TaxID=1296120 RepID=A0A1B9H2E5_9TREE|nr:hypothetical protein I316_00564 [Kwoniella heveanensis BCC8398]OCF40899.1 hypothetical protein I317_05257 [Kwoniella heveanensis CBS 569]